MRSSAAHFIRFLAGLCLTGMISGAVSADTIYLKNGKKITASHVVQQDGQIGFETAAGHLSLPASIVDHVVRDEGSLKSVAGTSADPAASLHIAPPTAAPAADAAESGNRAVHDGSIDLD
ncbi:MAG: hypothetical protein ACRD4Y_00060, partial [Candidatus Acidiferrales bacterium]